MSERPERIVGKIFCCKNCGMEQEFDELPSGALACRQCGSIKEFRAVIKGKFTIEATSKEEAFSIAVRDLQQDISELSIEIKEDVEY